MSKQLIILFFVLVAVFFMPFYLTPSLETEATRLFLSISTFLFAIFTGFFISRQSTRYNEISRQISREDGALTAIYRMSGHLGRGIQEKIGTIVKRHYRPFLQDKRWDYNLYHKSSTLTDIHQTLEDGVGKDSLPSLQNVVVNRIITTLKDLQVIRKRLISLHQQRVPHSQWILLYSLAVLLLVILATFPSQYSIIGSALKAMFATTVVFVMILLHLFDALRFFEGVVGETSAQDIVDIIDGKK